MIQIIVGTCRLEEVEKVIESLRQALAKLK